MPSELKPTTIQSLIASLHLALERLQSYTLPAHAHLAIQNCIQQAEGLSDALVEDIEKNRLAALYKVSQALGTTLDLDKVLTQVMDAAIELTGAERGFLILIGNEVSAGEPLDLDLSDDLELRTARSYLRETIKTVEVSKTVIRTVIETGEGVVTNDAQTDPRFTGSDSVFFYALRSVICAPLKARGSVIGVLYIDNRVHKSRFTEADLGLLNAFAGQAAIAIDNARLYTNTDKALSDRVAELETLTEIDRELNECLDYDRILDTTMHWMLKGTGGKKSWIALYNPDGRSLRLVSNTKETNPQLLPDNSLYKEIEESIKGQAPCIIPAGTRPECILAPLYFSGKPAGALGVEWSDWEPGNFSEDAVKFSGRLASRAANAIENACLYLAVQEANQEKSKFVSVVTHELRLPMTYIKGYADLMRAGAVGPVNEQQVSFLNIIRNNVERMSVLVSDLSDISRLETGRLQLKLSLFGLNGQVDEVVTSLRPRFEEKHQVLEINGLVGDLQVYADPSRVIQILSNLLSNACKYTPEEGKVSLNISSQGALVRLEVTDTGIGISQEDQEKLFSQFFRSDDPAVREQQGWGLGLNIARSLAEAMGGQMGVRSVLKEGSTFWFTLPKENPVS